MLSFWWKFLLPNFKSSPCSSLSSSCIAPESVQVGIALRLFFFQIASLCLLHGRSSMTASPVHSDTSTLRLTAWIVQVQQQHHCCLRCWPTRVLLLLLHYHSVRSRPIYRFCSVQNFSSTTPAASLLRLGVPARCHMVSTWIAALSFRHERKKETALLAAESLLRTEAVPRSSFSCSIKIFSRFFPFSSPSLFLYAQPAI